MSEPPDKPGPSAPVPPGETPRKTTTQPLAPVDPVEVADAAFETTGSFRTGASGVPILDAPFPTAPRPPAPARPSTPAAGAPAAGTQQRPAARTPTAPQG
ncbi:MAG TPA: hypothetical protein VFD38_04870, partial [Myxococcaceae bacterium]|nr:hypothetical protein [Myxococcaceae bacterium]